MNKSKYDRARERRRKGMLQANKIKPGWVIEARVHEGMKLSKREVPIYQKVIGTVSVVRYGPASTLKFVYVSAVYCETQLYTPNELVHVLNPDVKDWDLSNFGCGIPYSY